MAPYPADQSCRNGFNILPFPFFDFAAMRRIPMTSDLAFY